MYIFISEKAHTLFTLLSLHFDACLVIVSKDKIPSFEGELYMYKFTLRSYVIFKCERS